MRRDHLAVASSALALALLAPTLASSPAGAFSSTSPGKWAGFASNEDVPIGLGPGGQAVLGAEIVRGRRGYVLTVEGMLTAYNPAGRAVLLIVPLVNGIALNPVGGAAAVRCSSGKPCSVSGSWWLDLDAAEAANPGLVIGKQLTIGLTGADLASTGSTDSMILRARLERK